MRAIPVIDLKGGRAVRAVAGDRAHYQPLRSVLHPGPDPIGLAIACRDILGLREVYLADLDAIGGSAADLPLVKALSDLGLTVWVDAGVRDRQGPPALLDAGASVVIVGLETVRGPEALASIVDSTGPERLAFGLDLRDGRPLFAAGARWDDADPSRLAASAIAAGFRRLVLLDLARVGLGRGIGTLPLLAELAAAHPEVEWVAGGGISGLDDLTSLADAGADAALVGSALHDGRIGPAELGPSGGFPTIHAPKRRMLTKPIDPVSRTPPSRFDVSD